MQRFEEPQFGHPWSITTLFLRSLEVTL